MEMEDNESYMLEREPQDRERRNIQEEPSVPETTQSPTPMVDSADELSLPYVFTVSEL